MVSCGHVYWTEWVTYRGLLVVPCISRAGDMYGNLTILGGEGPGLSPAVLGDSTLALSVCGVTGPYGARSAALCDAMTAAGTTAPATGGLFSAMTAIRAEEASSSRSL